MFKFNVWEEGGGEHTHKLYGAEFSATRSNLAKEATLLYSFKSTLDRVLAIIP